MSLLKYPSKSPALFFIDPLFDLRLGKIDCTNLLRGAAELSLLLPAATGFDDRIISDIRIDKDFYSYLKKYLGSHGALLTEYSEIKLSHFVPWGWDSFSERQLQIKNINIDYPSLKAVKKINNREFCYHFNKNSQRGVPNSFLCLSKEDVLKAAQKIGKEFVIKPLHGNAGYGFIRTSVKRLKDQDFKKTMKYINSDGAVLIEPWLTRTVDLSTGFILSSKGKVLKQWHHQTLCNNSGTYFANYFLPNDHIIRKYQKVLCQTVDLMAQALHQEGYYGPVGFDSFEYLDNNKSKQFAAGIEINGRMNAGIIARAIVNKLPFSKPTFFRFISRKRHKLPDNYIQLKNKLGNLSFDKETGTGVILLTPLLIDHGTGMMRTARSAFTVTADSDKELREMDEELRRRFL